MGNVKDQSNSKPVNREAHLLGISELSYAEISRGTGISQSMLSRMFTDDPAQKRPNPTLNTLSVLREYLERRLGQRITYDMLIDAMH